MQKTFLDTHYPESALTSKEGLTNTKKSKKKMNKFERKFIATKTVKTFSTISVGRLFILVSDFDAYGDCAFKQCLFIKINDDVGCELNKPGEYCALNNETEVYPVLNSLT